MKQVIVKDVCIACGYCFSQNEFFKERRSGQSRVARSSLVEDTEFEEIKLIIDKCPVSAIEAVDSSYREIISTPERVKKFSLLKIFGNLELSKIANPDALSSQMLSIVNNKGRDIYEKLEHMIIVIILASEPKNKNITIDDDYISIKCQMKSRSHRLNMDKYEIKKYFDIPESLLNIYKNEDNFKIFITKNVLLRIFLLTILVEQYEDEVNKLSHDDLVSFIDFFVQEKFATRDTSVSNRLVSERPIEESAASEPVIKERLAEEISIEQLEEQLIQDQEPLVQEAPVQEAPVQETPVQETPVQEHATKESAARKFSVKESVSEKSSANKLSISELPPAESQNNDNEKIYHENATYHEHPNEIQAILKSYSTDSAEAINIIDTVNIPEIVEEFSLLNIFGYLELNKINKPDKLSTQMLDIVKDNGVSVYKKLESIMLVNILDSDLKYIGVFIKDNYLYIGHSVEPRAYALIVDKEEISKNFNVSNDILSGEILNMSVSGNNFEIYIGKTILIKIFLLTALYEKYSKEINRISDDTISEYTNILIEEFIDRNRFSTRDMSPEQLIVMEYNIDMYRATYNIKYLFTDKELKQVATRRDVAAIFNRDFYSLDGQDMSEELEQLKARCMNLVNGTTTVEYIVDYYTGKYS